MSEVSVTIKDLVLATKVVAKCLKKLRKESDFTHNPEILEILVAMDNVSRISAKMVVGLARLQAKPVQNVAPQIVPIIANLCQIADSQEKLEQRYLKGKFVLTTVVRAGLERPFSEETRENPSYAAEVVVEMVRKKLGVTITPDDLRTCHYTPCSAVVFWLGDLKYGSKCDNIIRAIQLGKNKKMNVYFNFMLTRRRTNLLYQVRWEKRAGKIQRFFSDNDGFITIVHHEGDLRYKLTDCFDTNNKTFSTFLVEEFQARFKRRTGA
jgi:hypothetical protein